VHKRVEKREKEEKVGPNALKQQANKGYGR